MLFINNKAIFINKTVTLTSRFLACAKTLYFGIINDYLII